MRDDSTVLAGDKRHSPCLGEVAERLLRGCTKKPCLLQNSSHFDAFTHPSDFPPVVSSLSARQNRDHLVSFQAPVQLDVRARGPRRRGDG